ncbi:hypothetical protein HOY80DRAFT_1138625 [Tuber brumale]|nr:hypothetical protein HOY80DRAFT_1138625 [Tuber brumale]
MSTAQILETLSTSQAEVMAALKEVADLLCRSHTHHMAPLDIHPGEIVDLYTLTIDCGPGDIIWQVEMLPNCHFKAIKRCKQVTIPNINPSRPSLPFLQPRYVWGAEICNQILQLIRIADSGANWWTNDSVFKSDQPHNIYYLYHPGFGNNVPPTQPRTIHAGYQAFLVGNNVPLYYRTSQHFLQLSSTRG